MTTPSASTGATQAGVAPTMGGDVAVPWATVLSLALVLSFADGFWVISMRGAVGAVRSGPGPFTTWWRESGVLLPLYVFAVLGSFTLALRWGRAGRRRAPVVAGGLVTAVSTVVGVGHLAAAAVGDYRLQWAHLQVMTSMRGDCPPDCLERLRQDTLGLQVRAVTVGALLLLVTNLGCVVWLTMCRGGRMTLARARGARYRRGADDLVWQLRFLLATGLLGAAVIHLAVVPEHLTEWPAAGVFFVVLAAAEVGTAAAVLVRPEAGGLLLAAVTSAAPLLVWVWSRLWGLPFGPSSRVPEPVGLPDAAAVVLELAALVLAVVLIRRAPALAGRAGSSVFLTRLWSTAVVAVTVIALAATQEGWFDLVPVATHG